MRTLLTGASGLVGRALREALEGRGHEVTRVVRGRAAGPGELGWDPANGRIDRAGLEGHDAVVHLAGEGLVGRWSPK